MSRSHPHPPVMDVTHHWPDESPEGTLVRAFVAFVARDGRGLAVLSSTASLAAFRSSVHDQTRPRWHEWTAESLRAHQPDMPLEAAEWQVEMMARSRETHAATLLRQFAGVTSLEALRALDAPELLVRAIRAAPRGATDIPRLTVLGHVREGDAAHVLYRVAWRGPEDEIHPDVGSPKVATLTDEGGAWRLELETHSPFGMPGYGATFYVGEDGLPPEGADDEPDDGGTIQER